MLVPIYPTTCCHIPTDHNLNLCFLVEYNRYL